MWNLIALVCSIVLVADGVITAKRDKNWLTAKWRLLLCVVLSACGYLVLGSTIAVTEILAEGERHDPNSPNWLKVAVRGADALIALLAVVVMCIASASTTRWLEMAFW